MSERVYHIRGTKADTGLTIPVSKNITIKSQYSLRPGRARDGVTETVDISADSIVRIELENGFVLWSRIDDLATEYGRLTQARDGIEVFEFGNLIPTHRAMTGQDRGLLNLGIKILDFFGIDIAEKAAKSLCETFEEKQLQDNKTDLYRCSLDDEFNLSAIDKQSIPSDQGPLLIFLHGTASSGKGSFGELWNSNNVEGRKLRQTLKQHYQDRVFSLEHRSLTESPIENALSLVESLPNGAELHLVSHSRGGLIGELICLSQCEQLDFIEQHLDKLFNPNRSMLSDQLGLSPLSDDDFKDRIKAYDDDKKHLKKLIKLFKNKQRKNFQVKRFVRVACPARGTTLASGRLDRWLSVLNHFSGEGMVNDFFDFLLAVVKERTDPRTLPGLEAMMPGSALISLLNAPALKTEADLSVISGDIEADSIWAKLAVVTTDWFFGADHDLVVNTGSMSGGLVRPDKNARFRKAQGPKVNHFNYFENQDSVQWLASGLTRLDHEHGVFKPFEDAQKEIPRWRDAVQRSRDVTTPRPLAVVLPGTMGSSLDVHNDSVWLNYLTLAFGGLNKINFDADGVKPEDLLDNFYGPLLEFLSTSHRVEIFPYDWRMSILDAAEALANKLEDWLAQAEKYHQPVHLVAHSMGGLVVRAMIADNGKGAALWQRITNLPNSRFLMLGTPNHGSYEAVRWLTGYNSTLIKLSLLDFTKDIPDIINLVKEYPGLLELLPFGDQDRDFTELGLWQTIKSKTQADWQTADENKLRTLNDTWNRLRNQQLPSGICCYVAGCQDKTVINYEFEDHFIPFVDRKRLKFIYIHQGDGTVPWASGKLQGIGMWYIENTAHDALCAQKRAFAGYLDLLMTGSTERLLNAPPASRTATEQIGRLVLPLTPPADFIPDQSEVGRLGFGGTLPGELEDGAAASTTVRVRLCHGDLSYTRHPVMVGHYFGDSIVSTERALDKRLGHKLSERLELGIYPGALDTHALFFNEKKSTKPGGAIVIGLGQVGELTPGLLETGVRHALLDFALQVSEWPDSRFGQAGSVRSAAISCPLIGSGAGCLSLRDSIEAILRGALSANDKLQKAGMDNRVCIDEIEFLELFEDLAISATDALRQILSDGELATAVQWPQGSMEAGQAGQHRVQFNENQEWWHRLEIIEEKDRPDQLRFIAITEQARAEVTLATGQLALAESFIASASRSPASNPEAAKTLFEMLLPLRLRERAPRQTDLVLLVDKHSARYPWELLENRWSDNGRPPAVNAGMVRQLKTPDFRQQSAHAIEQTALVVGNPNLSGSNDFSDLPGARNEAYKVANLLNQANYHVSENIDQNADSIIESLHRKPWRILHLAGHGVHDYELKDGQVTVCPECKLPYTKTGNDKISGMVIGKDTFLTPGDIQQMRWVPELVFINCCHLGKTLGDDTLERNSLAANLGIEFINMGVRAVIAAGWAVDDSAALAFSECFYRRMLKGTTFGEAVRASREEIWSRFPGVNTWGAYQCYGDPSFRLYRDSIKSPRKLRPYSAPSQLVVDLQNLVCKLKGNGNAGNEDVRFEDLITSLCNRIPANQADAWYSRADVCAALGLAWGETGRWAKAIEWLKKALQANKADCSVRVLEQLANFIVRDAAERWATQPQGDEIEKIKTAIKQLESLLVFGETEERLNLLGSAYKRLALVESDTDRNNALKSMTEYYGHSYEKCGSAYSFTNWATAGLLCGNTTTQQDFKTKIENPLNQVEDNLLKRLEKEPNFWDSAGIGDLWVVRLLISEYASSQTNTLSDNGELIRDNIIEAYRNAIQRGASRREIASIKENLDFIVKIIDTPNDVICRTLRQVQEEI